MTLPVTGDIDAGNFPTPRLDPTFGGRRFVARRTLFEP